MHMCMPISLSGGIYNYNIHIYMHSIIVHVYSSTLTNSILVTDLST